MAEVSRESLAVFKSITDHLTNNEFKFDRDDEELSIEMIVRGSDLPMEVRFRVIDERKVMRLISLLPFRVPQEKRADMAGVICRINDQLLNGCFDFNLEEGVVIFRLTQIFQGSLIGDETIRYMLALSFTTIDEYNDKLFMFTQDKMTADEVVG